jgi:hypothetical protein
VVGSARWGCGVIGLLPRLGGLGWRVRGGRAALGLVVRRGVGEAGVTAPVSVGDRRGGPVGVEDRLVWRALSVTSHPEGFVVGDPGGGEFVMMPELGVVIIDALRESGSLARAAVVAREYAGEEVDVTEFVDTLIGLGFVAEVNGRPVADRRDRRLDGGRIGGWLARAARPLFSPAAWVLYGGLLVACTVALILDPSLRLRGRDLLFLDHDPLDSTAIMFLVGMLLGGVHEGAHWLAARVQGVPARIAVSRRWYFLVLQTDMTGIWALPRTRRLSPLLAGMACDTIRLAVLLAARIAADAGVWHPSSLISRLIMAVIATTLAGLVFQFFIFLRTDIYALLITWLGCLNLTRVTQLLLRQPLPGQRVRNRQELAHASRHDLQIARWYRWVYLTGILTAGWFFVAFFGPNILTIAHWTTTTLAHTSPTHLDFWHASVLGSLALAPIPLTILVLIQEHAHKTLHRTDRSPGTAPIQ